MLVNYVKQEQEFGCVAACCAMVTGQTYREVAAHFRADLDKGGVDIRHALSYVCDHGFAAHNVTAHGHLDLRDSNRRMLRPFADVHIVRVLPCLDSEWGHALVMDKDGQLYDPEAPGAVDPARFYYVSQVIGCFDERPREVK